MKNALHRIQIRVPRPACLFGFFAALMGAEVRAEKMPPGGVWGDSILGQAGGGAGWAGFTDYVFLGNLLASLLLATALSALIAYHPKTFRNKIALEEIQAAHVLIMYAVVGAVIGSMVKHYGSVMGFVIFGIGGLLRFRTDVGHPKETGRTILVVVVGLCCGMDLPYVATLATAYAFVLIFALETGRTYRISVTGLDAAALPGAAEGYRRSLERQRCRILSEKRNPGKGQVTFVFRISRGVARSALEQGFSGDIPTDLRGALEWETG